MKKKIAFIICGVVFVAAFVVAITGVFQQSELSFAKFLNPNREKNPFFLFFTNIGEAYGVIPIALAFFLLPNRKKIAIPIGVTVSVSWILNETIKLLVARPRPIEMLLHKSSYSFPSGHAMNNGALYIAIIICLWSLCKNKKQKISVGLIALIPFIIGLSRVYFNVHYISDVVAGWCLGIMIAIVCCGLITKEKSKNDTNRI